jgi:hypothetical protein
MFNLRYLLLKCKGGFIITEKDYETENESDYEKYLEESIKQDLEWYEKEFNLMFKYKNLKNEDDIKLGVQMIDQFVDNIKSHNSKEALNLLAISLNKIQNQFPEFF